MLDHDDVERQLGLELDLVEGREVGRVRDGDRKPVAALAQRQHAQAADQLLVDDVARQLLEVDRDRSSSGWPKVSAANWAHRPAAQSRHIGRADQFVDELSIRLRSLAREVLGAIRAQLALLDERTRKTGEGSCGDAGP